MKTPRDALIAVIHDVLVKKCDARQRFIYFMKYPDIVITRAEIGEVRDPAGAIVKVPAKPEEFEGKLHRISETLKITRERVRQLLEQTSEMIRAEIKARGLDDPTAGFGLTAS